MGAHTIDANPDTAARVMNGIRSIVRALRLQTRALERDAGVSAAQIFVLRRLADRPWSTIGDLAEWTGTHQSSVSTVVARLHDRGMVSRRPGAGDARRVEVALTEAGCAVLHGIQPTTQERLLSALDAMPPGEVEALATMLERWLDAAGVPTDAPPMFFEEGS